MLPLSSTFYSLGLHLSSTIAALIGLGLVIAIHEFGHLIFCKLFSIGAPSFSIGFGPRLFSKKIGETTYSLSAIPIGGYVEIAGNAEIGQGEQEATGRDDEHSFANKPFYQKFLVMIAGIAFNFILAYAIFIGLALAHSPSIGGQSFTLSNIQPESTAAQSGFQDGDRIIALNDVSWASPELTNLPLQERAEAFLKNLEGKKEISVRVLHKAPSGAQPATHCAIIPTAEMVPDGSAGMTLINKLATVPDAIRHGITVTNKIALNTGKLILGLFRAKNLSAVGGPVMIIHSIKQGASAGIAPFLFMLGLLSITLGVFNLVPLPILDGGQIMFFSIEALIGRPIPIKIRYAIHLATAIAMLLLILFLSMRDLWIINTAA